MKHYILLAARFIEDANPVSDQAWLSFVHNIEQLADSELAGERLGRLVWLFDREKDVAVFAKLVEQAERFEVEYSVRYLDSDEGNVFRRS